MDVILILVACVVIGMMIVCFATREARYLWP